MSVIVNIDHSTGDLTQYTSTVTDGGNLSVSVGAALAGTNYGLSCLINDTTSIYGVKSFTMGATYFRARFYVDPNGLAMNTGNSHYILWVYQNSLASSCAYVNLNKSATSYQISVQAVADDGVTFITKITDITDAEHYVEFQITRASSNVASDGTFNAYVDGTQVGATYSSLDNYDIWVLQDRVRLGGGYLDAGTSGTYYLDELVVNDDGGVIGPVSSTVNITVAEGSVSTSGDAVSLTYTAPIAFGVFSSPTVGTATLTWGHNHIGSPSGALVFVMQNGSTVANVGTVTYGGSVMTQVSKSPMLGNTTEGGVVYGWFLGSGIPAGSVSVQAVVADGAGTSLRAAGAISLTGDSNMVVVNTGTINNVSLGTPTFSVASGGTIVFGAIGIHSGVNAVTGLTPFANWNSRYEYDYTSQTAAVYSFDTIGTADVSAGWTQAADDAHGLAVLVAKAVDATIQITVAEGNVTTTGDAVTVSTTYNLTVAEGNVTTTGDAVSLSVLVPTVMLTVAEGNVTTTGDAVTVSTTCNLTTAEGNVTTTGDPVTLGTITVITVVEGSVSTLGDAVILGVLVPVINLTVSEGFVTTTGDAVTVTFSTIGVVNLTVAEGFVTTTGDAVILRGLTPLAIADGFVTTTGDAVTVGVLTGITASQGFVTTTGDPAVLSFTGPTWVITAAEGFVYTTGDPVVTRHITQITAAEGFVSVFGDPVTLYLATLLYPGTRRINYTNSNTSHSTGKRSNNYTASPTDHEANARNNYYVNVRNDAEVED